MRLTMPYALPYNICIALFNVPGVIYCVYLLWIVYWTDVMIDLIRRGLINRYTCAGILL